MDPFHGQPDLFPGAVERALVAGVGRERFWGCGGALLAREEGQIGRIPSISRVDGALNAGMEWVRRSTAGVERRPGRWKPGGVQ